MTKRAQKVVKSLRLIFLYKKPLKRLPRLGGFFARTETLQDTKSCLKNDNPSTIKQLDLQT